MRIILDCDGVIADFHSAWYKHTGLKKPNPWPYNEYSMKSIHGIDTDAFWKNIDDNFWSEIAPTPWAHDLIKFLEEKYGPKNICLVTLPPTHALEHIGSNGKVNWIKKHFPDYLDRYMIGSGRHFCAGHDSILIDDYELNIQNFRACGGCGILFPREWNSLHDKDPLEYVTTMLRKYY